MEHSKTVDPDAVHAVPAVADHPAVVEPPPALEPAPAANADPAAAPAPRARSRSGSILGLVVALLTVAMIALAVVFLRQQRLLEGEMAGLRAQLASRVESPPPAPSAPADAAEPADRLEALAQRITDLEGRAAAAPAAAAAEVQGLRDEGTALEVERLVTFANQELQVNGSVAAASGALQSADARLAHLNRPQYVELRRAIARDIERLRATPVVDVTGMAIRLDQLQQAVETWPLLADPLQRPAADEAAHAPPARVGSPGAGAPQTLGGELRAWLAAEFGDLVRIREVATPDTLLVDSQQQVQIRDRLRLRLLSARLALLAHDDRLFHADLGEAATLISRYFDLKKATVATALAQVKTLAATPIVIETPSINDSVAALHLLHPSAAASR